MTPLLLALLTAAPAADPAAEDPAWLHVRDGLPWTAVVIDKGDPIRVVFLGGSITEGNGYRPLVEEGLKKRLPNIKWAFENAGVASTGSTTGVFRASEAVMIDGRLPRATLLIAEAAVNDDQDERLPAGEAGWGMEGIARMWSSVGGPVFSPDILMSFEHVFIHFPNPSIVEKLRAGEEPVSVAAHEAVAERYDIPSVNVAAEVARRIDEGTLTWEEYGGTHPGPMGHRLAAEMILKAIDRSIDAKTREERTRRLQEWLSLYERGEAPEPAGPLQADAIDLAQLLSPSQAAARGLAGDAWTVGPPAWDAIPGTCRRRFKTEPLLHTTELGETLTYDPVATRYNKNSMIPFTALGLYVLAGPDAGAVEVSVPGEEPKVVQLYHDPHSKNLHYPRTVLLYRSDKPAPGPVTVKVVKGDHGGTAVRIVGVGLGFITRGRVEADAP